MDIFKNIKNIQELYETDIVIPDIIPNQMPKYAIDYFEELKKMDEDEIKEHLDNGTLYSYSHRKEDFLGSSKELVLKQAYNSAGMYAFISWSWIEPFVEWLNHRKTLEVMAGRGWFTHALRLKGIEAIATDDFSWAKSRGWKEPITEVLEADAIESIKLFGKQIDVLLLGWPYMDNTAYRIIKALHEINPKALIVYIGEPEGGCTANSNFFDHFEEIEDELFGKAAEKYQQWYGIHDYLMLGKYKK